MATQSLHILPAPTPVQTVNYWSFTEILKLNAYLAAREKQESRKFDRRKR